MTPSPKGQGTSPQAPHIAAPTPPWHIHAYLMGMVLLWGASWPAGRALAQAMPAFTSASWRFAIASAVLVPWLLIARGWPRLSRRQWAGLVLGGVVGVFIYAACFMLALQRVEASRAAMVVTTNPVITTVLAAWLFKERFNARIAIGLVLAVVGAAVVLSKGNVATLVGGGIGVGEWLLLACAAAWSAYTLIGKALMKGVDSLAATAITSLVGTVLLMATALVVDGPASMLHTASTLSAGLWATMLFLSLGSTVLAYAWYNRGIAVLGAGTAASYISLVPVFGVALSALTLGERLDASLALGGVLAVVGLTLANWGRRG